MGRKGMKSFIKSARRPGNGSDSEEDEASLAKPAVPAPAAAAPAATKQSVPAAAAAGSSDEDDDGEGKTESRGQMVQRHKREMQAHKKAIDKLGKSKKDEIAKLTKAIEDRHAKELKDLEQRAAAPSAEVAAAPAAAPAAATSESASLEAGVSALGIKEAHGPTKAQKRRDKQAAKAAAREAAIQEELAALGTTARQAEETSLLGKLLPLGLRMVDIRADGHCMYRALEDQLTQKAGEGKKAAHTYQQLRELAAEHIREHKSEYLPFLLQDFSDGDPDIQFEQYCHEVEATAAWGGQVELRALADVLKRPIQVVSAELPTIVLGPEYDEAGMLQVCYMRHAFGLGEHYNSVAQLRQGGADDSEEGTDEGEEEEA